tara:strand:+ start:22 stop:642 length:621 start_codon:yes stop_codon:yes gene_type:complete
MTMRLAKDGSIVFRLYSTDVVTWHPDNSITVNPYPSKTTDAFAYAVLPYGINPCLDHALGTCLNLGDYLYKIDQITRLRVLDDKWCVVEGLLPIVVPQLDRVKAREALKASRWNDFMVWRNAYVAMEGVVDPDYFWSDSDVLLNMLADQSRWVELHRKIGASYHRYDELKLHVYRAHGCISVTDRMSLRVSEVASAVRARRIYRTY